MKCISQLHITNPKLELTDEDKKYVTVPCGKCIMCLINKRTAWSFRLEQELKISDSALFITLTYSDEEIIYGNNEPTLVKTDIQTYIAKLRRANSVKIKYYAVGEYGTKTERPHYHAIIYNLDNKTILKIEKLWEKGQVHIAPCNIATINYTTKYMITKNIKKSEGKQKAFSLMSKNLGLNYLSNNIDKYHVNSESTLVRMQNGNKINMPRYYKDKIFSRYDKARYTERTINQMRKAEIQIEKKYKQTGKIGSILLDQLKQQITHLEKRAIKNDKL